MAERKKRSRASLEQRHELVKLMKMYPAVASGLHQGTDSIKKSRQVWEKVAAHLNAIEGCRKSANKWKRCWIEWKSCVKKQAIKHKLRTVNPPSPKPLKDLICEVIKIGATKVVDGDGASSDGALLETTFSNSPLPSPSSSASLSWSDEETDKGHNRLKDLSSPSSSSDVSSMHVTPLMNGLNELRKNSHKELISYNRKILKAIKKSHKIRQHQLVAQNKTNELLEKLIKK